MSHPDQSANIAAAIATVSDLATVDDVAELLGVKPNTVRQHLHAGVQWLPQPARIAGRLFWQRDQLVGLAERKPAAHRPRIKPTSHQQLAE